MSAEEIGRWMCTECKVGLCIKQTKSCFFNLYYKKKNLYETIEKKKKTNDEDKVHNDKLRM